MVLNKKALKLVVCMSLIVALAFTAVGITVAAMYENTHNNTGNQASDIVSIAETQVGYSEGYDGYTKYGDWYGGDYFARLDWCAMFVSWCANQAGVDTSTFPSFALCSAGADWFISQGEFQYSGSYAPKAGDLIFYSSYGDIYHVGLVTGSDDYNVYSIEGNYNEAVYNVSYPLSYGDILGYATPSYKTADGSVVTPTVVDNDDNDNNDVQEDSEEDYTYSDEDSEEDYTYSDEDSDVSDTTVENEDSEEEVIVEDVENEDESDSEEADESDSEEADEVESEVTDTNTTEDESTDTTADDNKEVTTIKLGDVNGDGRISALDALLIQRYLALDTGSYDFSFVSADVNQDGEITIIDALMILEIVTGLA